MLCCLCNICLLYNKNTRKREGYIQNIQARRVKQLTHSSIVCKRTSFFQILQKTAAFYRYYTKKTNLWVPKAYSGKYDKDGYSK